MLVVMYFWADVMELLLHDDRHNVGEAKHRGSVNAINYCEFYVIV